MCVCVNSVHVTQGGGEKRNSKMRGRERKEGERGERGERKEDMFVQEIRQASGGGEEVNELGTEKKQRRD